MIIPGRNLIISADGQALAAAKSCTIDISADTIPVSSPTDGQWDHSIAGRKSWKISTNHLLEQPTPKDGIIKAVSYGWQHPMPPSFVIDGRGNKRNLGERGIMLIKMSTTPPYGFVHEDPQIYDTYTDTDIIASLGNYLEHADSYILALITNDAYAITQDMANTFTVNGFNFAPPVSVARRQALAAIFAHRDIFTDYTSVYTDNDGSSSPAVGVAQTSMILDNGKPVTQTPLRDRIAKVGQTLHIKVNTDGFIYDTLEGDAICKTFNAKGSVGNIANGSFSFVGTGPLE